MEICIVHLADSASEAGTIEVCHEMGVVSEMALVEGELEVAVVRMT